ELKKRRVRFLLLQFTDLLGVNKAVEVPASQFEKALAGEVTFDGSALEGFARVEEADALLVPDLGSFRVFPWESGGVGDGDGAAGGGGAGGGGGGVVGGQVGTTTTRGGGALKVGPCTRLSPRQSAPVKHCYSIRRRTAEAFIY